MISLPRNTTQSGVPVWIQPNDTDVGGSLWATTNIDANSNAGKIRVGDRMMLNTAGTAGYGQITTSGLGLPGAFRAGGSTLYIYALCGTKLLQNSNAFAAGSFGEPSYNGAPPTTLTVGSSDMEIFNGYLYITGSDLKVWKVDFNSSNPTPSHFDSLADSGEKHLTVYGDRMYNSLGSSQIISWNSSDTVATSSSFTVQLDATLTITWIRAASNRIWIGTISKSGGKGYVYEWDGVSTQVTKSYRLESTGTLSCVIKDDIPYIFDTNGNLLVWNGGTFTKLTGLNRKDNVLLQNTLGTPGTRCVHSNGMSVIKGKICVLIDTRNYNTLLDTEETMPAGVYEYDPITGDFKHKYSLSYLDRNSTRIDNEDFGQTKISAAGALTELNLPSTSSGRNGTFLAGAIVYSDATTTLTGVWNDDSNRTKQKAGSIITSKISATDSKGGPSVQNTWQKLFVLYKQLSASTDKITVKYRTSEQEPVEGTITWTSTTTFTVPNSSVVVSNYWTSGTGGEVEVLNGIGAGRCAHITNAVLSAGSWTVTVDETYTGATGTAIARFQNWTKYLVPILYNNSIADGVTFDQEGIDKVSNWIQFKVWMLFTGKNEIEKLLIINQDFNPAR